MTLNLTESPWWKRITGRLSEAEPGSGFSPGHRRPLSGAEFRRALQREWSRGHRIALPVSLVVVSVEGEDWADRLKEFIELVAARLRCTDDFGWHETGRLGILLPHTDGQGAWCLIEDLRLHVQNPDRLEIKVFASS